MFEISDFNSRDKEQWDIMWREYDHESPEERIQTGLSTGWDNVLNNNDLYAKALRLKENGKAVGLVTYIIHPFILSPTGECYLSNVFVLPEHQGKGGGRMLINSVIVFAKQKGLFRVTWITKPDNIKAKKLYDKITNAVNWDRYEVKN